MQTEVRHDADARRYELFVAGAVAGWVDYVATGAVLDLVHTEIADDYRGQGLGGVLAEGVMADARASGRQILPSCPFLTEYVRSHPEDVALVPAAERPRWGLDRS